MTKKSNEVHLTIKPPQLKTVAFRIVGTAPYVQCAFSQKAREQMHRTQEEGSRSKSKNAKQPKDFEAAFEGAKHKSREGWPGIPANGIRAAMISAGRVAGFVMTRAKLSLFVEPDGFDAVDGTPLVRITKGEPIYHEMPVRLKNSSFDLRARPMWTEGWEAIIRVRFDERQFNAEDVANLLLHVGLQVGLGEGRADSRDSAGMGWGHFTLAGEGK